MDYREAMNFINDKSKLGIVPGLDNVRELLLRLGNPQNEIKCLHIAGTNGKGSIFAFVEDILLAAGYKVARYVSPTIFTYLERFSINKKLMEEENFAKYISEISDIIKKMEEDGFGSPTAFEIETAVAFMFFRDRKVDFALIECGMGGSLDATNVIEKPTATVIASISMDHMQFLGDTLNEIAENKAGIIKENSIVVAYPQEACAARVLEKKCELTGSRLIMIEESQVCITSRAMEKTEFIFDGKRYCIRLLGDYQVYNAACAIALCERLSVTCGIRADYDIIKNAIEGTSWQGRFTKIKDKPAVFVDGAHNEKAWLNLAETLNKYFTNKRIIYIIGVLKDKEYEKLADILCKNMKYAVAVTPPVARGLDKDILCECIKRRGVPCSTAGNEEEALEKAFLQAGADDIILVCGSLSFLSGYLTFYERQGSTSDGKN